MNKAPIALENALVPCKWLAAAGLDQVGGDNTARAGHKTCLPQWAVAMSMIRFHTVSIGLKQTRICLFAECRLADRQSLLWREY